MEGRTNLVPRLQQDAYMHDLAAAQPGNASISAAERVDQFVCLNPGCGASFPTSDLLEQHYGVHAVQIGCKDDPAIATESDTYTSQLSSAAGYSEGYAGASSKYSELPCALGNLPVVHPYNNNSKAPWAGTDPTAHGPSAAGYSTGYAGASSEYSELLHPVGDLPVVHKCDYNSHAPWAATASTALGPPAAGYLEGYAGASSGYSELLHPVGDLPVVHKYDYNSHGPWAATASTALGPPAAGYSKGYAGASSGYSDLPYALGDLPVVHPYNNNSNAPWAGTDPTALGPPAAGLRNKNVAASFDRSGPLELGANSLLPGGAHDFSKDSVDLTRSALPNSWNPDGPPAEWHYPVPSCYIEDSFTANAASVGNTLVNGTPVHTNTNAGVDFPLPMPTPNSALAPLDIGPPTWTLPTCTECNKTFGRQSDLERHARMHQAGSNVFQCQVEGCTYSNYRKDKLREHVRRRHSSEETA